MFYFWLYLAFAFVFICGFLLGGFVSRAKMISERIDANMAELIDGIGRLKRHQPKGTA